MRAKELFLGSKPEEKRVLIQTSLQNLRLKNGVLLYDWKKPFDNIAKAKECNVWGPEACYKQMREFIEAFLFDNSVYLPKVGLARS